MSVVILPRVLEYLDSIVFTLFEKGYFSYLETSQRYIDELVDDIEKNLQTKQHKPAPKYFDKYGKAMKYAVFKKNRRTCWYAFFKTYNKNGETFYVVRFISNNHIIAQHL